MVEAGTGTLFKFVGVDSHDGSSLMHPDADGTDGAVGLANCEYGQMR